MRDDDDVDAESEASLAPSTTKISGGLAWVWCFPSICVRPACCQKRLKRQACIVRIIPAVFVVPRARTPYILMLCPEKLSEVGVTRDIPFE